MRISKIYILILLLISVNARAEIETTLLFDAQKLTGGARLTTPVLSPNCEKIIFSYLKKDKLWLADLQNKNITPVIIAEGDGCGMNAQWLTDKKIMYQKQIIDKNKRVAYAIFIYDCNTGKSTQISSATYNKNNPVAINELIFSISDLNNVEDNDKLTIMQIDNQINNLLTSIFPFEKFNGKQTLKKNNISLQSKAIYDSGSPEYKQPQFLYYTDNLKLIQFNTFTSEKKQIAERVISFNVSPDAKKIAYNKDDDIMIYNIDTNNTFKLDSGAYPFWLDTAKLIFIKTYDNGHDIVTSDIYLKNILGGLNTAVNITDTLAELEYEPVYDSINKRIYFSSLRDGNIKYFDFDD